jgi:hypothetical protein
VPIDKRKLEQLRLKRWEKELKRRRKGRTTVGKKWGSSSQLLEFVREGFRGTNIAIKRGRDWIIEFPENFCLISNPTETLNLLYSIVWVSRHIFRRERLFLDQIKCKRIDIGASALLDILTSELRREARCAIGGRFPLDQKACDLVQCMGITRFLGVSGVEPTPDLDSTFTKVPLMWGKKSISFGTDQERASTKLGDYLNTVIKKVSGLTLSDEIKKAIANWAGEIITNAEEHSGRDDWYAIAYMVPSGNGTEATALGECQLAIFGFGRSIAEGVVDTLSTLRKDVLEEMQRIAAEHTKSAFFIPKKYDVTDLLTLLCLQDGVSRFSDPDRGTGTVQFIEAFQAFGRNSDATKAPSMALVSGRTRILFDDTYPIKDQVVNGARRKVIAFNSANNLEEKPDEKNVHSLDNGFPGTILTCRFFVEKASVTELGDAATGTIKTFHNEDHRPFKL